MNQKNMLSVNEIHSGSDTFSTFRLMIVALSRFSYGYQSFAGEFNYNVW